MVMINGKWNWLLATSVLLLSAGTASAVYTPNPAGRWAPQRFFLAGDFQFNVDKDLDKPRVQLDDTVGFFVRPAYSVAPNLMLYGRLGFQDADKLKTGFAAGFGAQGAYVLPRAPEWAIGGSFDFLFWDTKPKGAFSPSVEWVEFQVAPAVSYNIPRVPELTPYAGLLFDFLSGDVNQSDPVGLLFGTNFDPTNHVRLDAQFRVISETGFFLSAGYMF